MVRHVRDNPSPYRRSVPIQTRPTAPVSSNRGNPAASTHLPGHRYTKWRARTRSWARLIYQFIHYDSEFFSLTNGWSDSHQDEVSWSADWTKKST